MKTKNLITVLLLFCSWSSFAQNEWLDKLSTHKEITQISITKGLINLMPDMASSVNMNGVDIKKLTGKLDQIDIFTSEDDAAKKMMRQELTSFLKTDKSYEVLMKIKDEEENIVFYGQKEGIFFKSLIMFTDDGEECVIIRLLGKFTPEDIQKVTEKKK
jgi:hypothetical protein